MSLILKGDFPFAVMDIFQHKAEIPV